MTASEMVPHNYVIAKLLSLKNNRQGGEETKAVKYLETKRTSKTTSTDSKT